MTATVYKLELKVGGVYLNRRGEAVTIISELTENSGSCYTAFGMRFQDDIGRTYRPDGTENNVGLESDLDLIIQLTPEQLAAFETHRRVSINSECILDELGYLAAMGQTIRAVKVYRAIYGTELSETKEIILKAAEEMKKRYEMPYVRRIAELEECLRKTRQFVVACAANGFRDSDALQQIYTNNGAISKLVPVLPDERLMIEKMLTKIINKS